MAKLKAPLLSTEARGSVGPRLTFSKRKSGAQVRFQRAQKDRTTPDRTIQRGFFSMAMGWWHELTDAEKDEWLVIGRTDC